MKLFHNSQSEEFRLPTGAVKTESAVTLSLKVLSKTLPQKVELRLWNGNEVLVPMTLKRKANDEFLFSIRLTMPKTPGLLWYYFKVTEGDKIFYYSNNPQRLGGVGEQTDFPTEISYQITVYKNDFKTPEWFKNAVMYQIFPDRFCKEEIQIHEKKNLYYMHKDWYEPLLCEKHPYEDGPACNDFYGGNLKGIIKKLGYLKELGITAIYLNPIFEAFSNHRYDTGDYEKIDPILGTEADFAELCQKAEKSGIRLILDGVFSHVGSDSVYFNKYKTYGEGGAYYDKNSQYKSWFQWNGGGYNSWWGCSNLPNVNETTLTYIDHILTGENAIIKKWLRLGASGWRLDVADELPDEFIKTLRSEVKSTKEDAVIIGEVWEDASNKVSYGSNREFVLGEELDGVMNYPFRDSVIKFLLGEIYAEAIAEIWHSLFENYPKEVIYSNMNILGTHDTKRLKTVLAEAETENLLTFDEKQNFRLDIGHEAVALKRVRLAFFLQMTFVGVPCIYYGDEIGMQGLEDPFNRMPFSWRYSDLELLDFCKKMIGFRKAHQCFTTGTFTVIYAKGDVLVYTRQIRGGRDVFGGSAKNEIAVCAVNRGEKTEKITVKVEGGLKLRELFSGKEIVANGDVELFLPPFGAEAYTE